MRIHLKKAGGRLTASLAVALILAVLLSAVPAEAGICEKALGRCLADVGMASLIGLILSGGIATGILVEFCVSGYVFCLQYYV